MFSSLLRYAGRVFKDVQDTKQAGGKRQRKAKQNATRSKWKKH